MPHEYKCVREDEFQDYPPTIRFVDLDEGVSFRGKIQFIKHIREKYEMSLRDSKQFADFLSDRPELTVHFPSYAKASLIGKYNVEKEPEEEVGLPEIPIQMDASFRMGEFSYSASCRVENLDEFAGEVKAFVKYVKANLSSILAVLGNNGIL